MAIQFDNRISWMDVIAIAGIGATAIGVVFGVQSDVEFNAKEIVEVKTEMRREFERVQDDANKDRDEILDRLEATAETMETIRVESASGRKSIEEKIDRLIERELKQ